MNKLLSLILSWFLVSLSVAPAYGASAGIKLLFFYQDNCKWCRMMEDVMADPTIAKILKQNVEIVPVNIHGKEKIPAAGVTGEELKKKFGIFWIPAVIFLDGHRKELLKIPGVVTKEDFKDLICHEVKGIVSPLCL